MPNPQMPAARDFGWDLRDTSTSHFQIHQRANGQFCAVLNHALLRGVTAEMLRWWFQRFTFLDVRLPDTPGYEEGAHPAYLLWHPIDHCAATILPKRGEGPPAQAGASIHIQEAMQYDRFGWRYPVDKSLRIHYVEDDGWAMGHSIPILGPVMMLRIHFKDVVEDGINLGVHYHYEVVIGVTSTSPIGRFVNRRISAKFGPEFFEAWHRHNVIEVGTFENFLPALYEQREHPSPLEFPRSMDRKAPSDEPLTGFDRDLFDRRVAGYEEAADPHAFQAYDRPSFL